MCAVFNNSSLSPAEHNSHEARSWNVKMAGFSYSEPAKRPMGSPHGDLRSPPTAKRKMNIANIMNESVMATKGKGLFCILGPGGMRI